jgi:serine/threonine protein kinase
MNSCILTGMHGPTCIFCVNLTPFSLKLCDFGLAGCATAQAGTPAYMAPELLQGRGFSKAVDVYAFGVLLAEIFAEQVPGNETCTGLAQNLGQL